MIANVAPLIRLPAQSDVFDYLIPSELESILAPGHMVRVPFRSDKVPGVVLSLSKRQASERFRARPIDSLLESAPVLTPNQLALIKAFSEYYFVTPGSVARLMVPDRPERASSSKEPACADIRFTVSPKKIPALEHEVKKILNARFIELQDVSSFVWMLHNLVRHSKQTQLLVLFPTIEMISAVAGSVHKMCSEKLAIMHSGMAKGRYWAEYQKIRSGIARIILTTRQGVFLPIQKNSQIIFFDSTSDEFKQYDQHPRYDARIVGAWLANSTASKLLFASSSKILEEKNNAPIVLPTARESGLSVALVDMRNEMNQKKFSIISGATIDSIKRVLAKNKKVVVIALREESEKGVSIKSILEVLTGELKNCKISSSIENFDVLVATPRALEGLKLSSERKNLGLLVFASIEPLLAIPDYRSGERTLYRLNHWCLLARELGFSRIILQSYAPEAPAIRAFAYGEFEAFKTQELANRKELNYPPFSKLIKLSYRGKDSGAASELKKKIPNATGPFIDSDKRPSLLIKLSKGNTVPQLSGLGRDWIVDRDPENVL